MSGGEQQQLAIARALIGAPKVQLLGGDPAIVDLIGEILLKIAAETGIGVLLVEQNMGMVESVANRCCVMGKGRIVDKLNRVEFAVKDLIRSVLAL